MNAGRTTALKARLSAHLPSALLVVCATGVAAATVLLLSPWTSTTSAQQPRDPTVRVVPEGLQDASWLMRLREAQVKAVDGVAAFHDFQFTDRLAESGISFKHRIVDDAGKTYKAAHYDHGNGIAIADVDGDGRSDIYFVNQVGGNQLWKNSGGGRFEDITAAAGLAEVPGRSACRPRLPTSTTTGTRTCTSRRSAAATCSSRTTAAAASGTSPRHRGSPTPDTRQPPCSSTTTATAASTCSSSTSDGTRRTRSRATATSTTWRSTTPSRGT